MFLFTSHYVTCEFFLNVQEDGITVNFVVTLCESRRRVYWLSFLFGYKAVIQGIGLFLALRIRNVKVLPKVTTCAIHLMCYVVHL